MSALYANRGEGEEGREGKWTLMWEKMEFLRAKIGEIGIRKGMGIPSGREKFECVLMLEKLELQCANAGEFSIRKRMAFRGKLKFDCVLVLPWVH